MLDENYFQVLYLMLAPALPKNMNVITPNHESILVTKPLFTRYFMEAIIIFLYFSSSNKYLKPAIVAVIKKGYLRANELLIY